MDIGKIKYEQKKRNNLQKKTRVDNSLKELTVRLNCGPADLATKMKRAVEFLEDGHMVRLTVRLCGREKGRPQFAIDLLNRLCASIADFGKLAHGPPKMVSFHCVVTLSPTSAASNKARAKRSQVPV